MKIAVIGAGRVGLVTAIGLCLKGHEVVCIDIDSKKVEHINMGYCPFYEPHLKENLSEALKSKRFSASTNYYDAVASKLIFLCVGTPISKPLWKQDIGQLCSAVDGIAEVIKKSSGFVTVVVKSTVLPGTTDDIVIKNLERVSGKTYVSDFGVVVFPEFLQEGNAFEAFNSPDRIVIGRDSFSYVSELEKLYFGEIHNFVYTDHKTAEMIKCASNAFISTKISFINEIGAICKKYGLDVQEVANGMSLDKRIGSGCLNAGIGFGGACLPKDLMSLVELFEENGITPKLLLSALEVNEDIVGRAIDILRETIGEFEETKITILGLSFKPDTDDISESPAINVVNRLLDYGAIVKVYDPMAMDNARGVLEPGTSVIYCNSPRSAVRGSKYVVVLTDWEQFRDEELYRNKIVVDCRRILSPQRMREVCKKYEGLFW